MTSLASVKPLRHVPGEPGIWVLIFGDLTVFALFFLAFMYYRGAMPDVFHQSHLRMDQPLGALNTFLLLTSSWFVATGVNAYRCGNLRIARIGFRLAICCGIGFAIVKYFEYSEKIRIGITLNTNKYFTCYFMFTGIHLAHVILGMVLLSFMLGSLRGEQTQPGKLRFIEVGATFWHMVDLLWIVLFALFYMLN